MQETADNSLGASQALLEIRNSQVAYTHTIHVHICRQIIHPKFQNDLISNVCPMLTRGLLFIHDVIFVQASEYLYNVVKIVKKHTERISTLSLHLGSPSAGSDWLSISEHPEKRFFPSDHFFEASDGIPEGFQIYHEKMCRSFYIISYNAVQLTNFGRDKFRVLRTSRVASLPFQTSMRHIQHERWASDSKNGFQGLQKVCIKL